MQPGVMLIVSLATLYILAMVIFWHCLWGQQPKEPLVTEVPFALKEGQTILGVAETTQGIDFSIGDYVRDEHYYDL
jgi:hypothetical protein